MKRTSWLGLLVGAFVAFTGLASDAVVPQGITGSKWVRGLNTTITTTSTVFTAGATINLVGNCYADGGSTTQGLAGVTVQIIIAGGSSTGVWYTATVTSAPNGAWTCTASMPPTGDYAFWQVKLTDVNTNVFYYMPQRFIMIPHL